MGKTKKDSPKFKKEKRIERFGKEHRREETKILPKYQFEEEQFDEYDDEDELLIDDD